MELGRKEGRPTARQPCHPRVGREGKKKKKNEPELLLMICVFLFLQNKETWNHDVSFFFFCGKGLFGQGVFSREHTHTQTPTTTTTTTTYFDIQRIIFFLH